MDTMSHSLVKRKRRTERLLEKELQNCENDANEPNQDDEVMIPIEETDDELERSDHETDSEQEASDGVETSDNETEETTPWYGKDGFVWNRIPTAHNNQRCHPCNVMKLGHNKKPPGPTTEIDWFNLYMDDFVIKKIVEHTNNFICSFTTDETRRGSFRITNEVEIRGFIGLLILIGTLKYGTLKQLWDTNMGIGCDLCICAMSKRRFETLVSIIHYDDHASRSERKKQDKFTHIREIFEHIVGNFQKYYTPSDCVCIDEQLIGFRGRCSFRQYIPSKPAKYGIKIWALVDANTFYTYNLEPYLGKSPSLRFRVSNKPEDVVLRLVQPIENSGRNITADNWFTSIPLI